MITERIQDYTETRNDKLYGQKIYSYHSPTHWGNDGVCEVRVRYNGDLEPEASLKYGCGGHNSDFNAVEIADAMTQAFARAKVRLQLLTLTCRVI
jgi:hypothetical protein